MAEPLQLVAGGHRLEAVWHGPRPDAAPTLVLVIQGENDAYGTLAQVDAIVAGARTATATLLLPDCGHAPWRERPDETTRAVVDFALSCLP